MGKNGVALVGRLRLSTMDIMASRRALGNVQRRGPCRYFTSSRGDGMRPGRGSSGRNGARMGIAGLRGDGHGSDCVFLAREPEPQCLMGR